MNTNTWQQYLALHTGQELGTESAKRLGISPSTITRWRAGETVPDPQTTVHFARTYGTSAIAALIAAGYLDAEHLDADLKSPDLSDLDTLDIIDELRTRLVDIREAVTHTREHPNG